MEAYTARTAEDLRRILRAAPLDYLLHLQGYYAKRGGPGKELVAEEMDYRARPTWCGLVLATSAEEVA